MVTNTVVAYDHGALVRARHDQDKLFDTYIHAYSIYARYMVKCAHVWIQLIHVD